MLRSARFCFGEVFFFFRRAVNRMLPIKKAKYRMSSMSMDHFLFVAFLYHLLRKNSRRLLFKRFDFFLFFFIRLRVALS